MASIIHNGTNYRLWSILFASMAILCFVSLTYANSLYPQVNISIPQNGNANDAIWAGNIVSAAAIGNDELLIQTIQAAKENNTRVISVNTSFNIIDWQNPAIYRSPDFDISPVAMHDYVPSYRGAN